MTFLLVVALLLLIGYAASRFGSDTRVGREWTRDESGDARYSPPTRLVH